jgi:hypothetical protein
MGNYGIDSSNMFSNAMFSAKYGHNEIVNILAPGNPSSGKMETGLPVEGHQLISA